MASIMKLSVSYHPLKRGEKMDHAHSLALISRSLPVQYGVRRFSNAMTSLLAVLALALVSFGSSALAADGNHEYIGIGGGVSLLNDSGTTGSASGGFPALDVTASPEVGFSVKGSAGYAFANGFRVEGEFGYRKNSLDTMNVRSPGSLVTLGVPLSNAARAQQGLPPASSYADLSPTEQQAIRQGSTGTQSISGDLSALNFMANVFYDYDLGSGWKPYVGGGLGVTSLSLEVSQGPVELVDDRDVVFSYQVGGGVGYEFPLPDDRSVTVSLDWRYFGTADPTFKDSLVGTEFEAEVDGHDVSIGIRYGF